MDPVIAVYDACVLYSAFLRDFLVRLAIHGRQRDILRAKWTGRIHREWVGAVLRQRPQIHRARLRRTCQLMDAAVRGCRVSGYRRWERRLSLPDPSDCHVLAAAIACAADAIVTFNIADFPIGVLQPYWIRPMTPDDFIGSISASELDTTLAVAAEHRASLSRPPMTAVEYLSAMRRNGLAGVAAVLPAHRI